MTINFPFVEHFKRKIVSFGYCCCVLGASHFYIFSFGYSFGAIPPSKTAHFVYASAVIFLIEIASFVFEIL